MTEHQLYASPQFFKKNPMRENPYFLCMIDIYIIYPVGYAVNEFLETFF